MQRAPVRRGPVRGSFVQDTPSSRDWGWAVSFRALSLAAAVIGMFGVCGAAQARFDWAEWLRHEDVTVSQGHLRQRSAERCLLAHGDQPPRVLAIEWTARAPVDLLSHESFVEHNRDLEETSHDVIRRHLRRDPSMDEETFDCAPVLSDESPPDYRVRIEYTKVGVALTVAATANGWNHTAARTWQEAFAEEEAALSALATPAAARAEPSETSKLPSPADAADGAHAAPASGHADSGDAARAVGSGADDHPFAQTVVLLEEAARLARTHLDDCDRLGAELTGFHAANEKKIKQLSQLAASAKAKATAQRSAEALGNRFAAVVGAMMEAKSKCAGNVSVETVMDRLHF